MPDVLFVVALLLGFFAIAVAVVIGSYMAWLRFIERRAEHLFVPSVVAETELEEYHEFCSSLLPDGLASLARWRERMRKNKDIFFAIHEVKIAKFQSRKTMVGAFSLTPITDETAQLLVEEKITGLDFVDDHLCAPAEKPASLYLTAIAAKGFRARGLTVSFLREQLLGAVQRGIKQVLTKPHTADGLRLAQKFEFVPINRHAAGQLNRIYRLDLSSPAVQSNLSLHRTCAKSRAGR